MRPFAPRDRVGLWRANLTLSQVKGPVQDARARLTLLLAAGRTKAALHKPQPLPDSSQGRESRAQGVALSGRLRRDYARKESAMAQPEHSTGAYFLKDNPTEFHTNRNCSEIEGIPNNDVETTLVQLGESQLTIDGGTVLPLCSHCTNPANPRIS